MSETRDNASQNNNNNGWQHDFHGCLPDMTGLCTATNQMLHGGHQIYGGSNVNVIEQQPEDVQRTSSRASRGSAAENPISSNKSNKNDAIVDLPIPQIDDRQPSESHEQDHEEDMMVGMSMTMQDQSTISKMSAAKSNKSAKSANSFYSILTSKLSKKQSSYSASATQNNPLAEEEMSYLANNTSMVSIQTEPIMELANSLEEGGGSTIKSVRSKGSIKSAKSGSGSVKMNVDPNDDATINSSLDGSANKENINIMDSNRQSAAALSRALSSSIHEKNIKQKKAKRKVLGLVALFVGLIMVGLAVSLGLGFMADDGDEGSASQQVGQFPEVAPEDVMQVLPDEEPLVQPEELVGIAPQVAEPEQESEVEVVDEDDCPEEEESKPGPSRKKRHLIAQGRGRKGYNEHKASTESATPSNITRRRLLRDLDLNENGSNNGDEQQLRQKRLNFHQRNLATGRKTLECDCEGQHKTKRRRQRRLGAKSTEQTDVEEEVAHISSSSSSSSSMSMQQENMYWDWTPVFGETETVMADPDCDCSGGGWSGSASKPSVTGEEANEWAGSGGWWEEASSSSKSGKSSKSEAWAGGWWEDASSAKSAKSAKSEAWAGGWWDTSSAKSAKSAKCSKATKYSNGESWMGSGGSNVEGGPVKDAMEGIQVDGIIAVKPFNPAGGIADDIKDVVGDIAGDIGEVFGISKSPTAAPTRIADVLNDVADDIADAVGDILGGGLLGLGGSVDRLGGSMSIVDPVAEPADEPSSEPNA